LLEAELKESKDREGPGIESLKRRLEARRDRLKSELEAAEARRARGESKA